MWGGPVELARKTREVTAAFIASGIDPKKHIVFNQSQVHEHAELAWIFNCVARIGWLNRMTQFKEKAGKDRENASVGLYDYPVLMAADILVYRATHVPVGEDQKQHLELARDIAQKFNNDFADSIRSHGFNDGLFFPLPEPVITGPATRVMRLRDGTKKMSKSDASDNSRINLTDDADTIAQKIRKAKTDPGTAAVGGKGPRGAARGRQSGRHLCGAGRPQPSRRCCSEFGGGQFSSFKTALVELCVAKLAPIAAEMKRLVADPGHVDSILADGADRARAIAAETMKCRQGHRRLCPHAAESRRNFAGYRRSCESSPCASPATPLVEDGSRRGSMRRFGEATGTCMSTQRRSYETGHKPKCLVIIDDTAECDRAVYYASRWAIRVGGGVVMLRVIETEDQQPAMARRRRHHARRGRGGRQRGARPRRRPRQRHRRDHARTGDPRGRPDRADPRRDRQGRRYRDAGAGGQPGPEGPGPLVTMMAKAAGSFPIPVAIVPGDLSDADIDGLS